MREIETDIPLQKTVYPWHKWVTGKWILLEPGKDFQVTPRSFRQQASDKGRRMGWDTATRVMPDGTVAVRFCNKVAKTLGKPA